MDIAVHKLELINRIIQLDDISVFTRIRNILNEYSDEKDVEKTELLPIELLFKLIMQSENDYKTGKITTNEDFEEEAMSW